MLYKYCMMGGHWLIFSCLIGIIMGCGSGQTNRKYYQSNQGYATADLQSYSTTTAQLESNGRFMTAEISPATQALLQVDVLTHWCQYWCNFSCALFACFPLRILASVRDFGVDFGILVYCCLSKLSTCVTFGHSPSIFLVFLSLHGHRLCFNSSNISSILPLGCPLDQSSETSFWPTPPIFFLLNHQLLLVASCRRAPHEARNILLKQDFRVFQPGPHFPHHFGSNRLVCATFYKIGPVLSEKEPAKRLHCKPLVAIPSSQSICYCHWPAAFYNKCPTT